MGIRASVIGTVLLLHGCGASGQQAATAQSNGDAVSRDDVLALERWVETNQSWPPGEKEAALELIRHNFESRQQLTQAEFFLEIARVAALADNGHSNLSMQPVYDSFGLLPIRAFWFEDGLHVVRAMAGNERLLGARIVAIAGRPIADVVDTMARYHGGTLEHFRSYFVNPLLLSPELLHSAGVTKERSTIEVTFRLAGGALESASLETSAGPLPHPNAQPWRYLIVGAVSFERGQWTSVADRIGEQPWALQEPNLPFRYRFLEDEGVAHIQLRTNRDQRGTSIRDFQQTIEERIEQDRPQHIILDNRQNPGGDLTTTADFAMLLPTLVPEEGRVFSLTSNMTFSAGIYTAFFPESADDARTIVVGTRVGDREQFWAEGAGMRLPRSGHRIGLALQLHDPEAGCQSRPECHMTSRPRLDIAVGSLDPEELVGTRYSDFESGRDPQVEWVLAQAREPRSE